MSIFATYTPYGVVNEGEVGTVKLYGLWNFNLGRHLLRVTNPKVITEREVEASLPDSTILVLDLDEGSGNIVYDSSLYRNDGTLYYFNNPCSGVNCPKWVDGKFGKAIKFIAYPANDTIRIPDSLSLGGMDELTMEAWIKIDVLPSERGPYENIIIHKHNTSDPWSSYQFSMADNDKLYFVVHNTTGCCSVCCPLSRAVSSQPLEKNIWYHILGMYDGSTVELYLNGNQQVPAPLTGKVLDSDDILYMSYTWWQQTFNGTIDNVRIYNKALTPDETIILKPVSYD